MRRPMQSSAILCLLSSLVLSSGIACTKTSAGQGSAAPQGATRLTLGPSTTKTASAAVLPSLALESYRLPNGLQVVLHRDESTPNVKVHVAYHVGSRNDPADKAGLARLAGLMMYRTTTPAKQPFLQAIEKAGASIQGGGINALTDEDFAHFWATVPASSLAYALWLEGDRMGFAESRLVPDTLETQKKVLTAQRQQIDERPFSAQTKLVKDGLYASTHPYARDPLGTDNEMAHITETDVRQFMKRNYVPSNAVVTLSGNFDVAEAKKLIESNFGTLPPGDAPVRNETTLTRLGKVHTVVKGEHMSVAKLTLAWPVAGLYANDEPALELAARVLGSGRSSRLYKRLVEDTKLANDVGVYVLTHELGGTFFVEALTNPGKSAAKDDPAQLDKIKQIVMEEIATLASKGPSASELEQKKTGFTHGFVSSLERGRDGNRLTEILSRYALTQGSADILAQDYERYASLQPSQVSAAVSTWLQNTGFVEARFPRDEARAITVEGFDRTREPSLAESAPFNVPKIEQRKLQNGMVVYVVSRPGFPKVEAALVIKGLDVGETEENAGASYLTAAALTGATQAKNSLALEQALEAAGAEIASEGSKFGAAVALSVLRPQLDQGLGLLAETVLTPAFAEADVERLKAAHLRQLKQEESNAAAVANDLFPRLLFSGNPIGNVPTRGISATLEKLTRADLVKEHEAYFTPQNAALVLTGDVTADDAEKLVAKHFANWQQKDVKAPDAPNFGAPNKPYIFLLDAPELPYTQVRIGSLAPTKASPDSVPLALANAVLNQTGMQHLDQALSGKGISVFGASSALIQNKHFGFWVAGTGVPVDGTVATLQALRGEIEALSDQSKIKAEDLQAVQKAASRSFLSSFESLGSIVRQIASMVTHDVPLSTLDQFGAGILRETTTSVAAAAKQHLAFDHTITLVIGDAKKLEGELVKMGWGDVLLVTTDGRLIRKAEAPAQASTQPAAQDPHATLVNMPAGGDGAHVVPFQADPPGTLPAPKQVGKQGTAAPKTPAKDAAKGTVGPDGKIK